MKYRSTMIYFLAAVILIGLYIFDVRKEGKEQKAKESGRLIFQIEADHLTALTLKKEGQTIVLKKSGVTDHPEWRITSPIKTGTDHFSVERLKDELAGLKYDRVISERAADLSQFGLHKPDLTATYTENGEKSGSLSFGLKSPLDGGFYARREHETKVFLISAGDKGRLDTTLFDLRDKGLFSIESPEVSRVVVDRKSGTWIFSKKNGNWILAGDEDLKLDQEKVASLIRRTLWERASSFENENAVDLHPYGLNRPRGRITLFDGKKSEQMLLGDDFEKDKENRIYAVMAGRSQVVTVKKSILEDLPTTKEELKQKEEESGD